MLAFRILLYLLMVVVLGACAGRAGNDIPADKRDELVKTRIKLAVGYMQKGKLEIAQDNIDKALAIDADNADANHTMALLQWRYKDHRKARKYFRRALGANPDDGNTQHNYAQFLCEQGHATKAIKHFDKALSIPRYQTPLQANLSAGMCLVKSGMPVQAKQYFRAALSLQKNQSIALYYLALIHYETGNTLSARAYVKRFFATAEQETPEALLLAVKIERKLGAKDAERSYAQRLRTKFPDSSQAELIYRR